LKIEASFTADTLVILEDKNTFTIINFNPDWTYKKKDILKLKMLILRA
jgi:hypothetical protein